MLNLSGTELLDGNPHHGAHRRQTTGPRNDRQDRTNYHRELGPSRPNQATGLGTPQPRRSASRDPVDDLQHPNADWPTGSPAHRLTGSPPSRALAPAHRDNPNWCPESFAARITTEMMASMSLSKLPEGRLSLSSLALISSPIPHRSVNRPNTVCGDDIADGNTVAAEVARGCGGSRQVCNEVRAPAMGPEPPIAVLDVSRETSGSLRALSM